MGSMERIPSGYTELFFRNRAMNPTFKPAA